MEHVFYIHTKKEKPPRDVQMGNEGKYSANYSWRGDTHGGCEHDGGEYIRRKVRMEVSCIGKKIYMEHRWPRAGSRYYLS